MDDIFADHLRYVKKQVQDHITSSYGDGDNVWTSLSPSMYVILTTPNGWEGSQQHRMRQAAINGGLVTEDGGRRVKFVTEAEVSYFELQQMSTYICFRQLFYTLQIVVLLATGLW